MNDEYGGWLRGMAVGNWLEGMGCKGWKEWNGRENGYVFKRHFLGLFDERETLGLIGCIGC